MGSTLCVKPCERGVVRCSVSSCCEPTANLPISFSKRGANIFLFILNRRLRSTDWFPTRGIKASLL